jgi:putative transposase
MAVYCYSLTIAYQHTRVLLECHGLLSTETATARPVFERVFREYGLPAAIRTAFCSRRSRSTGSRTSTWWMRLGIVRQRIHPGSPQENRAYERMHRTLKRRAVKPVQRTCARQQRQFDGSGRSTTQSDHTMR